MKISINNNDGDVDNIILFGEEGEAEENMEVFRQRQRQQQCKQHLVKNLPVLDNEPVMGNVLNGEEEDDIEEQEVEQDVEEADEQ
jgi:hypothetical protein